MNDVPAAPTGAARPIGGGFLAGATGRLLPASVALRWFGAAVVFHALAWLALGAAAPTWPQWQGGLGWPLAALHLVTLGTLASSAIGASMQLLPVATRQPVRWPRLVALLWWLWIPGVAALTLGMALERPVWMIPGACAVLAVLAAWGVLLALNLRGARGMPGVVLHGRGALVALALLAASAIALVALWNGHAPADRGALRALHLVAGVFGVMGLLVLGLSSVLLPMFALAPVPADEAQRRTGAVAIAALALAGLAAFAPAHSPPALGARALVLVLGAFALGIHVDQMRRVLRTGMRRELGRAARLMRLAWGAGALALALAAAQLGAAALGAAGAPAAGVLGRLFVLAAVGGWLLSFLFGVLHRILPFLAAMHAAPAPADRAMPASTGRAAPARRRPPTPSALTLDPPLGVHLAGHVAALALLALAIVWPSTPLLLAAALAGSTAALAFGLFFAVLVVRLVRARQGHRDVHA